MNPSLKRGIMQVQTSVCGKAKGVPELDGLASEATPEDA
jgi:hypothetical protein